MARYDKYIDFEFEFDGEFLNYEGVINDSVGGICCSRCEKEIKKGNKEHVFTLKDGRENGDDYESRYFGNDCIKYVFGAGLVKGPKL